MKKSKLFFILPFTILLSACAAKVEEPPAVKIIPKQLLGKSSSWVETNLGQPEFKRRDGQAEIWQYKSAECVLSVFIYEDMDSGQRRVLHFDGRDFDGNPVARDTCLSSL